MSETKQSQYVAVYDALIKSTCKNEDVLNQLIAKICKGRENYIKHQLHEKLLASNATFNAGQNEQITILNEITIIKTLRFKNQIVLARKKWQKLFDKCLQLEQPGYLEILLQEKFKLEVFENHQLKIKDHQKMNDYAANHAQNFSHLLQLRTVYNELMLMRKRSFILFDEHNVQFGHLKQKLTTLNTEHSSAFQESFFLQNMSWAIVYFLEGQFEKSFNVLQKVFEKINDSIPFLKNNNKFVLDFIKFYSDLSFFNKNYKAVETLLAASYKIPMANDMYLRQREILHFLIQNRLYSTTTQYQKVDELLATHESDFEIWLQNSSEETRTMLNAGLAISFFIAGNFREALYYSNNLINPYTKMARQEVLPFAYIFETLIAYELNHFVTFESVTNNAVAFFYRYPQHKFIGLEIINALQSAFGKTEFDSRKIVFENLLQSLRAHEQETSKQVIYNYFDFPSWFESKISKIRYQDYRKKIFTSS